MKRALQLFALATIVFSAVACSGGDAPETPAVVKIGVDDASKMKKSKPDAPKDAGKTTEAGKPGDAPKPMDAKSGDAPKPK